MNDLNNSKIITTKVVVDTKDWRNDRKLLIAAIQSYLTGSQDIYVALRNKPGIVHKPIEHLNVDYIFDVSLGKC